MLHWQIVATIDFFLLITDKMWNWVSLIILCERDYILYLDYGINLEDVHIGCPLILSYDYFWLKKNVTLSIAQS